MNPRKNCSISISLNKVLLTNFKCLIYNIVVNLFSFSKFHLATENGSFRVALLDLAGIRLT